MDPWSTSSVDRNTPPTTFQDNFISPTQQSESSTQPHINSSIKPFAKLPDSQEYLASLERRLSKIQQQPNILRSLQETKDAALRALLSEDTFSSGGGPASSHQEPPEELLPPNPLLLKLAPERIALSTQELIRLLDADQLQLQEDVGVAAASSTETPPKEESQEE